MKTYYVYIIECGDLSFYTGITNNLLKRFIEHTEKINPGSYTANKHPLKLVYYEEFDDVNEAINREKQIKGWSREKKEALIRSDIKELVRLSNIRIGK